MAGLLIAVGFAVLVVNISNAVSVLAQEVTCTYPAEKDTNKCGTGQCLVVKDGKERCVVGNPAARQLVDVGDFGGLLQLFIQIFLAVAGGVAVVFLMVGGFQYIAAHGNEEATEKAKKTLTGAIIGIVIIVLAYAIVAIVNQVLTNPPT